MTTTPGEGVFASSLLVRRYVCVRRNASATGKEAAEDSEVGAINDGGSGIALCRPDFRSAVTTEVLTAHSSEGDPVLTEEGRVSLNPAVTG